MTDAETRSGAKKALLLLVIAAVVLYVLGFAIWRVQLDSLDDKMESGLGLEGGLPSWLDGDEEVLFVDHDSFIDRAGALVFSPLVGIEEAARDVNYFHLND